MSSDKLVGHHHIHIIIILISVIAGTAIAGVVLYYPRAQQAVAPPVTAQQLVDLEEGFVGVAQRVLPAVVNISAERVELRRLRERPDFEEFFRQFPWPFEGPEEEGQEPRGFRFPWPFGQPEGDKEESEPKFKEFRGHSLGSGWIYSEDGYIVTNAHVVKGALEIKVQLYDVENDDTKYPAKLIGTDPRSELAVIKVDVDRKLPTLALGNSNEAQVGQWVVAVGSPLGLAQTVTAGIISAKGRFLPGASRYIRLGDIIQTDAAINFGNSGGPLVNLRSEVIGVSVAIASQAPRPMAGNIGIGFAIASDTAKQVVPQLIQKRKVTRGWLGIGIEDLSPNMKDFYGAEYGALVSSIRPDTPASRSDLQVDDVIVAVDGQKVEDTWDLQKIVMSRQPGAEVTLDVIRDKQRRQVQVKLGEMPAKYAGLEVPKEEPQPEAEEETEAPPDVVVSEVLGVKVAALASELARHLDLPEDVAGIAAVEVDSSGPAAGKVKAGDIITHINRQSVTSLDEYNAALDQAKQSGRDYVILRLTRKAGAEVLSFITDIPVEW